MALKAQLNSGGYVANISMQSKLQGDRAPTAYQSPVANAIVLVACSALNQAAGSNDIEGKLLMLEEKTS